MSECSLSDPKARVGDKVRIRSGPYEGTRGVVRSIGPGALQVELTPELAIELPPGEVTNYSLAARRAWLAMPKRAGRPRLPSPRKKMVSLRIDIDIWERLGRAVETGKLRSREEAVNRWLRDHIDQIDPAPDTACRPDPE